MSQPRNININLIGYKIEEQLERKRRVFLYAGSALLTFLLIGIIFTTTQTNKNEIHQLQQEMIVLQAERDGINTSSASMEAIETLGHQIQIRQSLVEAIETKQNRYSAALETLLKPNIPGVLITDIVVKGDSLVFSGYVNSHDTLVKLLQWFKEDQHFKGMSDLTYKSDDANGEISFTIRASLEVQK